MSVDPNNISVEPLLNQAIETIGLSKFLRMVAHRPTTVAIVNVSITDDNWNDIPNGTDLSGVLAWKLREKEGQEFDYAFEAAPTPYMTSLGEAITRDTEITRVYIKRRTAVTLNMQLEYWAD